jgi:hypothetical protein
MFLSMEQTKKMEEVIKAIPKKSFEIPQFLIEYNCEWKGENNMEERINKFFEENKIEVDENGNFEMYVVVDADDKDHEIGAIICGNKTEVYVKERAYEDLKENNVGGWTVHLMGINDIIDTKTEKTKERKTIKDRLLSIKDKIYKISSNKENIKRLDSDKLIVNKYKVIEGEKLNPVLKYKIMGIGEKEITVRLYNNLTEKFEAVCIYYDREIPSSAVLSEMIKLYLSKNEKSVNLQNIVNKNGIELQ